MARWLGARDERIADARRFLQRTLALLRPARAERELAREIASHLAMLEDELARGGLPPDEARLAARRRFGGVEQAKEHQREARAFRWIDETRRDVHQAVRLLSRAPGFTTVAILTLALGIGANTAIFSVVHAVLLQPLPYRDGDRLVRIVEHVPANESPNGRPERRTAMVREDFAAWRAQARTLSAMAAYVPASMTLTGRADASTGPARMSGARVSAAIFPMLSAAARTGRLFDASGEAPGADAVIVLSDRAWRTHFAADPAIVGRTATLDGRPHEIVGVMEAAFEFPDRQTEFWIPFVAAAPLPGRVTLVPVIARLKDDVSLDTATAEANAIGAQLLGLGAGSPAAPPSPRFEVIRVKDQLVAPVRSALLVLMVAVGGVLLIACANVANLLLARHASRQHEMAIRGALGASRGRLARQMLAECLVLGLAGGAVALVVAFAGIRLLQAFTIVHAPWWIAPGEGALLPRAHQIGIDGVALAFTLCASLVTGLLFGMAPVLRLSRSTRMPPVNDTPAVARPARWRSRSVAPRGRRWSTHLGGLVADDRQLSSRMRSRARARHVLVVAQVAMATVLLIGAGLLIRSFVALAHVPTGYDATNVLTFQVVLPPDRAFGPQRLVFAEDLVSRLRAVPHVRAAGFTSILPLARARWTVSFAIPGVPQEAVPEARPQTRFVSRDYLRAMGVRLIDGRSFDERDAAGQPRAILVNLALARRYLADRRPVGTFVMLGAIPWEIVGVVDDVRQGGLETEADPQFFVDFRQLPPEIAAFSDPAGVFFAARTEDDPLAVVADLRALVRQIEPAAALDSVFPMEQLVSSSIARPRFYTVLLGIFAGVAGTLAAVGIYGVLAYTVTQRTREIGIRMALGAPRRQVLTLVLGQGARLAGIGIVLGLAAAVTLTRYLSTLLFGLTPLDPSTFAGVSVIFALTALVATYIPARRATNVDPLIALRHD